MTGLVLMVLGAVDPLEGSIAIVAGSAMAAAGAYLGRSKYRSMLFRAFGLILTGVAIMFGMSAMGGIGGSTGRSMWWALTLLPYPAGWVLGLIGSARRILEMRAGPSGSGSTASG
jgi:hypothetical protein